MRHRKFGWKLNRSSSHRKALRRNLVQSLFRHGKIVTTMPKAKSARRDAERLITIAKVESLHNYRKAFKYLQDDALVHKLFKEIAIRYSDRPGGYTAIHRLAGNRLGDNASQVMWQLVTWEPGSKPKARRKKKTRRRPDEAKGATAQEKEEALDAEAGTAETDDGAAQPDPPEGQAPEENTPAKDAPSEDVK